MSGTRHEIPLYPGRETLPLTLNLVVAVTLFTLTKTLKTCLR